METNKNPNLDNESWLRYQTTPHYMEWRLTLTQKYKNYMVQEGDRSGKFPKGMAKQFLSVCLEHGWKLEAQETAMLIAQYG